MLTALQVRGVCFRSVVRVSIKELGEGEVGSLPAGSSQGGRERGLLLWAPTRCPCPHEKARACFPPACHKGRQRSGRSLGFPVDRPLEASGRRTGGRGDVGGTRGAAGEAGRGREAHRATSEGRGAGTDSHWLGCSGQEGKHRTIGTKAAESSDRRTSGSRRPRLPRKVDDSLAADLRPFSATRTCTYR